MTYAYYLYRNKQFCRLDVPFGTVQEAFDAATDVMRAAGDYYTRGEVGCKGRVMGKITKELKYEAIVLELDGLEVGTPEDRSAADRQAP